MDARNNGTAFDGDTASVYHAVRRHTRHDVSLEAAVMADERELDGVLTTLGFGGGYLWCPQPLSAGTVVTLPLVVTGPLGTGEMLLPARVVYHDGEGFGLEFLSLGRTQKHMLRELFMRQRMLETARAAGTAAL